MTLFTYIKLALLACWRYACLPSRPQLFIINIMCVYHWSWLFIFELLVFVREGKVTGNGAGHCISWCCNPACEDLTLLWLIGHEITFFILWVLLSRCHFFLYPFAVAWQLLFDRKFTLKLVMSTVCCKLSAARCFIYDKRLVTYCKDQEVSPYLVLHFPSLLLRSCMWSNYCLPVTHAS